MRQWLHETRGCLPVSDSHIGHARFHKSDGDGACQEGRMLNKIVCEQMAARHQKVQTKTSR